MENQVLKLADLGVDETDPGTQWHPNPTKFDDSGLLPDLTAEEVAEHATKPEAADQPDAGRILDHDGDE